MNAVLLRCGLLAALMGTAGVARADDPPIKVTVVAILASTTDPKVDKELTELFEKVRGKDRTIKGMVVESSAHKSMKIGDRATIELIDRQSVEVVLRERNPMTGHVSLTLTLPSQAKVSYTVCCGKYAPFNAGYETADKRKLLVAVMVMPCPGAGPRKK